MTVATTDAFTQTRDEIIADALANVGAVGPGKTPTNGDMITHASRALNRLVKSLDADGEYLWRVVRRTLTTVAAQAAYSLATDVIALDEPANYMKAGLTSRSQIFSMARDDYMVKSDRTTAGTPNQFFLERTLATTTVTFWPVPTVSGDTIEYAAFLRCKDFVTGSNNPDFNTKWLRALVLGLSAEIAAAYLQDPGPWLEQFEAERQKQLGAENENGNMTLVAFGGWSG